MSAAVLVPALAATLFGSGAPAADGYVASASAPSIWVVGQPFIVELELRAMGEGAVEVPCWLLSPAGWLVDRKPLTKRASKAEFLMQPGQTLVTEVDLTASLSERFGDKPKDFRIQFAEADGEPTEVIALRPAAEAPTFDGLTDDQLDDFHVVLETSGGTIWLELWPDVAPNHVRNFLDLAGSKFYDGSAFHRVIPGFMVQGGQSKEGTPAPRKLEAEFNSRKHTAGVLSAARLGNDINSATSEFFLVHETSPHLDGNYTPFGQVVSGMD
ncbi:MAG: peptidylprolyl isomerase [Planctomycetota bacterium]